MIPAVDYIRILPELVLAVFGIIVMMVDPLIPDQASKKPLGIVALVGTLVGLAATIYQSLGIDPATEVRDRLNRPVRLCTGEPIAPLFSAARTVG